MLYAGGKKKILFYVPAHFLSERRCVISSWVCVSLQGFKKILVAEHYKNARERTEGKNKKGKQTGMKYTHTHLYLAQAKVAQLARQLRVEKNVATRHVPVNHSQTVGGFCV